MKKKPLLEDKVNEIISILKRPSKEKTESKRTRWLHTILQTCGLLLLFGSWIFQNRYESIWQDKLIQQNTIRNSSLQLELKTDIYDFAITHLTLMSEAFHKNFIDTSSDSSPSFFKGYLSKYCFAYNGMRLNLNEMLFLNKEEYSKGTYTHKKDEIYRDMVTLNKYEDYNNTKGIFDKYDEYRMKDIDNVTKDLQSAISDMYTFQKRIEGNNNLFLTFYIIGSILLAISYLIKKISYLKGIDYN